MILRTLALPKELDDLLRRLAFDDNKSKGKLMVELIVWALVKKNRLPPSVMKSLPKDIHFDS